MWTCSECGERLDPTFDTCWKCGTSRHPPREQPAAGEQPTPGIGGTVADPARGPGRWHGWMFDRGPSAWRYILRMGVTSLVPSLVVAALLMVTLSLMGRANTTLAPDFKGPPPVVAFIAVVVISPAVETLLLSLGISVLSIVTRKPFIIATLSAVLWGVLHSSAFLFWGIVIAWPFFVFSCAYLAWRPLGWSKAIAVAMTIHMFQNLIPGLLLLFA